jgi:hypothetical protein
MIPPVASVSRAEVQEVRVESEIPPVCTCTPAKVEEAVALKREASTPPLKVEVPLSPTIVVVPVPPTVRCVSAESRVVEASGSDEESDVDVAVKYEEVTLFPTASVEWKIAVEEA